MKVLGGRYYNSAELRRLGLAVGENVEVHETSQIVAFENIQLGNNVRIDPFCILTAAGGRIQMGSNIHVSAHCCLFGGGGIVMEDFSGVSPGCRLFSASDTFTGEAMIGATLPPQFTKVVKAEIRLEMHTQLGAGTTVLPGVTIAEGAVSGAHSLVTEDLGSWAIHAGSPARMIRPRENKLLTLAERYRREKPSQT